MTLEMTSVVCEIGTEVDREVSGWEWDRIDEGCDGLMEVTEVGSAFTGSVELPSARGSSGVDVDSETGAEVSTEGWVPVFVLTRPGSRDGSTGRSTACVWTVSTTDSTRVEVERGVESGSAF